MVYFMLNNLCRPACEVFRARLHIQGLILHLDGLISLALTGGAEKRQTAFLGVVYAVLLDDFGIEHYCICRSSSALIKKGDDALAHADHIRCHADATFSVRHQRIKQVLCDMQISFCCDLRLSCKEDGIVHQFFNHFCSPSPTALSSSTSRDLYESRSFASLQVLR